MLRSLEEKLTTLVEGTFSRAFKSQVRPVELARKLAREMDAHRVRSLSRTYVPNEYTIWLSERDREQFDGYEGDLRGELSGYLLEHARSERYSLVSRPEIAFKTDGRLRLGEFGIQARLVRPEPDAPADGGHRVVASDPGHTQVYSAAGRVADQLAEPNLRRSHAQLRHEGRAVLLGAEGVVLGRSRDADVVLQDENVSRRHAEVRPSGGSWIVRDLGSTNGVKVNGRRVDGAQSLRPGDQLEIGLSRLVFEED